MVLLQILSWLFYVLNVKGSAFPTAGSPTLTLNDFSCNLTVEDDDDESMEEVLMLGVRGYDP